MKVHRFYLADQVLNNELWLKEPNLIKQWTRVLRYRVGDQLVLFDGQQKERLYRIEQLNKDEVLLHLVTDLEPKKPTKDIYLFWSVLKKDKNDWVLQKCSELGVSHFVPILAGRSEKTGINMDRAQRIVIEAAEQCGRSDIPTIREPIGLGSAIEQYADKCDLYVCEQLTQTGSEGKQLGESIGLLIGPEGGWTDSEKQMFKERGIAHLGLHDFTLRAETACVAAVTKVSP